MSSTLIFKKLNVLEQSHWGIHWFNGSAVMQGKIQGFKSNHPASDKCHGGTITLLSQERNSRQKKINTTA